MKVYEHAQHALLSVFNDGLSFQIAINQTLKQEKKKIHRLNKMSSVWWAVL